jgi:hypothetical protein
VEFTALDNKANKHKIKNQLHTTARTTQLPSCMSPSCFSPSAPLLRDQCDKSDKKTQCSFHPNTMLLKNCCFQSCSVSVNVYTGWFMSYGHNCSILFHRSLSSKNFLSTWILLSVMVLWALLNSHKCTPVNSTCMLQDLGQMLFPPQSWKWCKQITDLPCALACALFTTEHGWALWLRVGFSKICFKHRSVSIKGNYFMKLNLDVKFVM